MYEDKDKHARLCDSVRGVCPAECGKKGVISLENLNEHWDTCQRVVNSCTCCEAPLILQSEDYICSRKVNSSKKQAAEISHDVEEISKTFMEHVKSHENCMKAHS